MSGARGRGRTNFVMRKIFHSIANRAAALFMKLLFGYSARIYVVGSEHLNRAGGFLLASNHVSHFDPLIISSVVRRKIDWMAMAEFFTVPLIGLFLRSVDAFPAARDRADRKTIRTAIERLKNGRIVGVFPEGGIRDGARSLLEGAPLRPGASTLAHMAGVPILPCVIVGSDRLYSKKSWRPLRRTPIWIAFGHPISSFPELTKSCARQRIERELAAAFKSLYAELREEFSLMFDDLRHPPRERMKNSARAVNYEDRGEHEENIRRIDSNSLRDLRGETKRNVLPHFAAKAVDSLMCASMNLLQSHMSE